MPINVVNPVDLPRWTTLDGKNADVPMAGDGDAHSIGSDAAGDDEFANPHTDTVAAHGNDVSGDSCSDDAGVHETDTATSKDAMDGEADSGPIGYVDGTDASSGGGSLHAKDVARPLTAIHLDPAHIDIDDAHCVFCQYCKPENCSCAHYQCIAFTQPNRRINIPKAAVPHCFPSKMDWAMGPDMLDPGFRHVAIKAIVTFLRMVRNGTWKELPEPYRLPDEDDVRASLDAIPCPNQPLLDWLVTLSKSDWSDTPTDTVPAESRSDVQSEISTDAEPDVPPAAGPLDLLPLRRAFAGISLSTDDDEGLHSDSLRYQKTPRV